MGIIFFTFKYTKTSRCQVQTYTIGVTTKNAWQEESFPAVLLTLLFAHSILSSAECKLCQVSTRVSVMVSKLSTLQRELKDSPLDSFQPGSVTLSKDSVNSDSMRCSRTFIEAPWDLMRKSRNIKLSDSPFPPHALRLLPIVSSAHGKLLKLKCKPLSQVLSPPAPSKV